MTTRFDRNGIRILDPVRQSNKLTPTCRLPDDHDWGPPRYVEQYDATNELMEQRCRKCGARDRYWRSDD